MTAVNDIPVQRATHVLSDKAVRLNEAVFSCIASAITLAKQYQVKRSNTLKDMLIRHGFDEAIIKEAFIEIGKRVSLD